MITPLLKGLSEEKIVMLEPTQAAKLGFLLSGIVRLVNKRGDTIGLVLDKKMLDEIEEETEASSPEFLTSVNASRESGRVSSKEVKKRAHIK